MPYQTFGAAVYGIDASIIEVEVDVSGIKTNEDHFHTVGLPDAAVRESRDRVRSALRNCGYDIPPKHITVNLAPANIRKEGSGFDLPMALGILGAYGGLTKKELLDCVFVGELSLDGGIRGIRGTHRDRDSRQEDPAPDRPRGQCPGSGHGEWHRSLSREVVAGRDPFRKYRQLASRPSRLMATRSWAAPSTTPSTSKTSVASKRPSVLWRLPVPEATTS
jgi:hypothetical protein